MNFIETTESLEALFDAPATASLIKVAPCLTPAYRQWIMRSRFCVLSTIGPNGTDGSPRGDRGPVVQELDKHTLLMPDWRGNNRLDSLRNIVADGRVSLMFMVAGSDSVIRINGTAKLTTDADMRGRFAQNGKLPKLVIIVRIAEVYAQCARAIMRAGLWRDGDQSHGLPSMGDILAEQTKGDFDGQTYDAAWPERARKSLW